MEAKGSGDVLRKFNHPFVQACSMFIGEILCLLVFKLLYFYYWRKHVSIIYLQVSLVLATLKLFLSLDIFYIFSFLSFL